jgi:murein DD-endopeptidase MepM/ murein hydrolase activator NlpD
MADHILAPYWAVKHRRPSEYNFFKQLNTPVVKIMDGGKPDYEWVYTNLPNATAVMRDWLIDDNSGNVWREIMANPAATGKRVAQQMIAKAISLGVDKNRTLLMGPCNEPNVWVDGGREAATASAIAFCDELTAQGWKGLVLNLSVGWPRKMGTDMPPRWDEFPGLEAAIKRGGHTLGLHEYWSEKGPGANWGWLAGRALKCTWDVPIIIGECGMSYAVTRSGIPTEKQGWQNHISDETYAAQIVDYHNRMSVDPRIKGLCLFLCDHASPEWKSKDVEPAYDNILARKSQLRRPTQDVVKPKTTSGLNARKGPGVEYDVVRVLPMGTVVRPVATNAAREWLKLDDGTWVSAAFVSNEPVNLPIDGVTPAPVPPGPAPTPVASMRYPLDSVRITQIYGVNAAAYSKFGYKGHNGLDLGCVVGTTLKASADGEVAVVADDPNGYGRYIRLWHPSLRCYTMYAHLSVQSVKVGQKVTKGQVIGQTGNTGNSTGPHLHWEIRLTNSKGEYEGGNPGMGKSTVDPVSFVAALERA